MSAADALRQLALGVRPKSSLLHTARLEARGVECYGEEAIVARCRHSPIAFTERAIVTESASHIAILEGNSGLFADLSAGYIARIWLLGEGEPEIGEVGVSVPSDPDLTQSRGDVFFVASDHPGLAADAAERVLFAGRALVDDHPQSSRTRAFAIRAFGTASRGAALFAVSRAPGFSMAVSNWDHDAVTTVRDHAGEQAIQLTPWTPRISKGR
jgi:hypothetical protein